MLVLVYCVVAFDPSGRFMLERSNKYIGSLGSAAIMVESKGGWDGVGICTCLNFFSQLPSCSICVVNNVVEEEPGCNMQGNSNEKLMSSILGLLEVRRRWNSQAVEAMCYWVLGAWTEWEEKRA